jgi:multicomponent K+:H+ antiporter subunit G
MPLIAEIIIAALLIIGGTFALIGSWGLIKLTDGMQRLHAPTKATTIGVGTALIASVLHLWFAESIVSIQEILIVIFLFVTAPLTALYLSKIQLHLTRDRAEIPPTGVNRVWATFDAGLEDDVPDLPHGPENAPKTAPR